MIDRQMIGRGLRLPVGSLLTVWALVGCSGDGRGLVAVQGRLTAQGQPLGNATVTFIPQEGTAGPGAVGRTDAAGHFSLIGSRRGARGCLPGDYRVRVGRTVGSDGAPLTDYLMDQPTGSWESIPRPYSSHDDTPLTVTVPPRGGTVTVDLPVPLLTKAP
jgi:hypothetical protein